MGSPPPSRHRGAVSQVSKIHDAATTRTSRLVGASMAGDGGVGWWQPLMVGILASRKGLETAKRTAIATLDHRGVGARRATPTTVSQQCALVFGRTAGAHPRPFSSKKVTAMHPTTAPVKPCWVSGSCFPH